MIPGKDAFQILCLQLLWSASWCLRIVGVRRKVTHKFVGFSLISFSSENIPFVSDFSGRDQPLK
jgi:hypothetical protein